MAFIANPAESHTFTASLHIKVTGSHSTQSMNAHVGQFLSLSPRN